MRSSQCSLLFEYANFSMQRMCFIKWIRAALPFGVNVNQYYTRFCIVKAHCWLRMICGVSVCWPFCVYAYRNQRWIMRFNNRNTDVFVCWCCMPYQKIACIQYKRNNYVSRAHVQPVRIVCVWMYLHEFDVCIAGSSKSSISISGQCRPINLISNTWNTAVITQKESLCRILLIKKTNEQKSSFASTSGSQFVLSLYSAPCSPQLRGIQNIFIRKTFAKYRHIVWSRIRKYTVWLSTCIGRRMNAKIVRPIPNDGTIAHTHTVNADLCMHTLNQPSIRAYIRKSRHTDGRVCVFRFSWPHIGYIVLALRFVHHALTHTNTIQNAQCKAPGSRLHCSVIWTYVFVAHGACTHLGLYTNNEPLRPWNTCAHIDIWIISYTWHMAYMHT